MTSILAITIVFIGSFISAFGALFLKKSSLNLKIKTILKNKNLITGLFLYGISTIMFIFALTQGELSILYPLASATYIWVVMLSSSVLKEKITRPRMLGISLIIIGIIFISVNV